MKRSSFLPVKRVMDCSRLTSTSRFSPSGVISKIQEKTSTGMNAEASTITTTLTASWPNPNAGEIVSTTWMISQDVTKYAIAT